MGALDEVFSQLRAAQTALSLTTRREKDAALAAAADALSSARAEILAANARDVARAREAGVKEALIDRLALDDKRLDGVINGARAVIHLDDPCGRVRAGWTMPNGLLVEQITVPLGVAAIIYESRPNVTVDAFCIAYKAGCAILLRGSSAARESNRALVEAIIRGLKTGGGVSSAVALAPAGSRAEVDEILTARGRLDVVIPRGGRELIRRVVENARVPVIETGEGNCHIYVAPDADMKAAARIIENAKLQKPGACNAVETLLVHNDAAAALLPLVAARLAGKAELRCDARALTIVRKYCEAVEASESDWETEFLDFILAIKTVDSLDEAIEHINRFGTRHSEAIITRNLEDAAAFFRRVDAACVYTNASTRFTDGGEFGFGAELGISTQKFHARGPMGLDALTTIKYRVTGSGQTR